MRQMLQLATLVALRAREKGHKEAVDRTRQREVTQAEARERNLRDREINKANDPRNRELTREAHAGAARAEAAAQPTYRAPDRNTPEGRRALDAHLASQGISPELRQVRLLMEAGQANPPGVDTSDKAAAARKRAEDEAARERERERQKARVREHGR